VQTNGFKPAGSRYPVPPPPVGGHRFIPWAPRTHTASRRVFLRQPALGFLVSCVIISVVHKCELIYSCHRVDHSFCLCIYAKLTEPKIHVGDPRNFLKLRKDHHLENGCNRQWGPHTKLYWQTKHADTRTTTNSPDITYSYSLHPVCFQISSLSSLTKYMKHSNGKRPLEIQWRRWEDNIKTDLQEIRLKCMD
jgi:hypothetical protein